MPLLIATHSEGKKAELLRLLHPIAPFAFGLSDLAITAVLPEDAESYEENARRKAVGYAALAGLPSLADDSGLEIDALDGIPGIRTARYLPHLCQDEKNVRFARLAASIPEASRGARFVCSLALAAPGHRPLVVRGTAEGVLATSPRGARGFGYDPIFCLDSGRTMAELGPEEKDAVSHRGAAARALRAALETAPELLTLVSRPR